LRLVAYLLDQLLLGGVTQGVGFALYKLLGVGLALLVLARLLSTTVNLAYYGTLEGILGWSLGKRLLRLRVGTLVANQPPGLGRALLRAGILHILLDLGGVVSEFLL